MQGFSRLLVFGFNVYFRLCHHIAILHNCNLEVFLALWVHVEAKVIHCPSFQGHTVPTAVI